jgi:hypothetical protein
MADWLTLVRELSIFNDILPNARFDVVSAEGIEPSTYRLRGIAPRQMRHHGGALHFPASGTIPFACSRLADVHNNK